MHADDVEAAIDVLDLAGDARSEIAQQVQRGGADFVLGDVALQRRCKLSPQNPKTPF